MPWSHALSVIPPQSADPILKAHPWGSVAWQESGGQRRQARALLQNWIREGLSADRLGPDASGGWFDANYYIRTYPDLQPILSAGSTSLPLRHYLLHGWREGRRPHLCFDPGHYLRQVLERGAVLSSNQSPLEHWLHRGLAEGLSPTRLLDRIWLEQRVSDGLNAAHPPAFSELHPWASAALTLSQGREDQAAHLLEGWISTGAPSAEAMAQAASPNQEPLRWQEPLCIPMRLSGLDAQPSTWQQVGWLAGVPLQQEQQDQAGKASSAALLHICWEPPSTETIQLWLRDLPKQAVIIADRNEERCRMLRRFGVASLELKPPTANQLNAWLPAEPWLNLAEAWFGLPAPFRLKHHGVVCLGQGGEFWDQQANLTLPYFPGFTDLMVHSPEHARAIAAWLWHCHQAGITLVEFRTQKQILDDLIWLPLIQVNPYGMDQAGLLEELSVRIKANGNASTVALTLETPKPDHKIAATYGEPGIANAAVLVSLYNYEGQIETALNSVLEQTIQDLELVVVDDASTDQGAELVAQWMEHHHARFSQCTLISHLKNGGLAAARNTAFQYTQAGWCFVLDADNNLDPVAINCCMEMTTNANNHLAVVHPLIRRIQPDGSMNGFISSRSWERAAFLKGNYVDAMALVRRSAWEKVNGYTHIPGGWEDYDFWCKLMEAGYHGVLCPHAVANYQIHTESMVHQSSHRRSRTLSRILQMRHPWLALPLGGSEL